jgi:anti-sigma regulatory factor (Ser/Thr protein kinase)
MPDLHVSLPAKLTEVRNLSAAVEEFGDANQLPLPTVFVINLALDELITNAVTHGTFEVSAPTIDVHLKAERDVVVLIMEDNGSPFDPTEVKAGDVDTTSSLEDRAVGGLGLHLVRSFAHEVSYEFVDGKNRLTVHHHFKSESA